MELIKSISSLWPISLIILVGIISIVFKDEIKLLFRKEYVKFKKGDTEFELKGNSEEESYSKEEINLQEGENEVEESNEESEVIERRNLDDMEWGERLFQTYLKNDLDSLNSTYEKMIEQAPNNIEKIRNKAIYFNFINSLGNPEGLEKLKKLKENNSYPELEEHILRLIGLCHKDKNRLNKAIYFFEKAAEKANNDKEYAENMVLSVECLFQLNSNEAYKKIMGLIKEKTDESILYRFYKKLSEMYNSEGENQLSALALEKAIEFKPNLSDIFNAAYRYGGNNKNEDIFEDLTLLHYSNILKSDNQYNNALNNIGVTYHRLDLHGKKIDSYEKSIEKNKNTLASSNLAKEYIKNGFYKKANVILTDAMDQETVHQNVGNTLNELEKQREKEREKEKKILDNAKNKQRFLRNYANSYFNLIQDKNIFDGKWQFENGIKLNIKQNNDEIVGTWVENETAHKIEGNVCNKAGRVDKFTKKSIISGLNNKQQFKKDNIYGYLYVSKDKENMCIMFLNKKYINNFYYKQLKKC